MDFCKYIKDFTRNDIQGFFETIPGFRCFVKSVEPAYLRGHKVLKVESELGTSYFTDFGVVYSILPNKSKNFTISNEYLKMPHNPVYFREPVGANGTDLLAYEWTRFVLNRLYSVNYNKSKRYELDLRLNCRDNVISVKGAEKVKLMKKLKRTVAPHLVKFVNSLDLPLTSAKVGV